MSSSKPFEEQSLTLGDRINWPFILGTSVMNLFNAILKVEGEQSEQEVRESALAVFNSIPTSWIKSDPQFKKDLEECFDTVEVDDRKTWCGRKVGPPQIKEVERINPWRLYHACVDVFQRRNLLSKPVFKELMTGKRFKKPKKKTKG